MSALVLKATGSTRKTKTAVSDDFVLKMLTFVCCVIPIVLVVYCPFVERQDSLLAKAVSLTGMNLFASVGTGKLQVNTYGSLLDMIIPSFLAFSIIAVVVLQAIASIFCFVGKHGRKIAGTISLVTSIGLVVLFCITMITSITKAMPFKGESVAFFELFSYSIGYITTLLFTIIAFAIGFFVKVETIPNIKRFWFMYLLLLIPMVLLAVFSFYPIFLQTILSFKEYNLSKGIWGSEWVGLQHFKSIFTDPDMGKIIFNTVYISVLRLVSGFFPPIILALMIYEINKKFLKNSIQTIVYIPHFFSWVIIYGIVFAFLSPDGIVNAVATVFGSSAADILTNESYFIPILIISAIWKELGWGTIIYLAALSSVDTGLYDAAAVDGIGPFRKLWYITLPGISGVIVFMTIMSVGNILKGAGGEQILMFANSAVMNKAEVIDTWVYWQGLGNLQYGLGAAVSFFQSAIGVVMVLGANKLSIKLAGRGMW